MNDGGFPPVLHNTVLAGPQVDSLRFGLYSPDSISPWALDLLQDAKGRAIAIRSSDQLNSLDIAVPWVTPFCDREKALGEWISPQGEVFQVWNHGRSKALPKITRSPILADLTSPDNGPGWLRVRGGGPSKRYPFAVILDLSSSWIWSCGSPRAAAAAAVRWWIDSEVLDPMAIHELASPRGHKVTRCDIAVDHQAAQPWLPESYRYFSTRAKAKGFEAGAPKAKAAAPDTPQASCYFGPRSFTLYLGKRGGEGPLWRIYDKTAQLAATQPRGSKTAWFWNPITEVWTKGGWNRSSTVWRAEVEVPSRMLHQLDGGSARMSSLQGLNPARLWSYCAKLTRHTDTDTGRGDRRKTSALWQMLQDASGEHPLLQRLPSAPEDKRPDLAAVREAIAAATALGASEEQIKQEVALGIVRGEERSCERTQRNNKLYATSCVHAEAEISGDLWKP